MQREIETLEIVQGENFFYIDSLENNGAKYLIIFDEHCEKNCNPKAFLDNATAGKHLGLSTTYNKQNLFHKSKLR